MSIIQGYRGVCKLGSSIIPVLPGSSVAMPKNYNLPPVIAGKNAYQIVAVEGLQFPVFNFNLLPTVDWFTADTLDAWFKRITDAGNTYDDVASSGALGLFDGSSGVSVTNGKHASFNIGVSQGEIVRTSAQFWGYGAPSTYTGSDAAKYTKSPASFAQTGYTSVVSNALAGLISWDLSWSNNLMPNPALPSDPAGAANLYPTEINAGMFTARLRLVFQADKTPPADGSSFALLVKPPTATAPVTFTIKNPLLIDNQSRSIQMPRSLREYNYILLGDYSGVATEPVAPIVIT